MDNKDKKERTGNNSEKMRRFTFGDLLIPLLGLFIFIMLTVFVYIPMIFTGENSYMAIREELKSIEEQKATLNNKLSTMKPIVESGAQLAQDLKTVNSIIPSALDVSDFTFYVDQLAQQNGLEFKEISSSNISIAPTTNASSQFGSNVSGISGPIVYEGTYAEIVTFIDQLQGRSPYIVETSNIFLRLMAPADTGESVDQSTWRLEINITGYYIPASQSNLAVGQFNPYTPFIPYTNFEETLGVFKYKSDLLKGNQGFTGSEGDVDLDVELDQIGEDEEIETE